MKNDLISAYTQNCDNAKDHNNDWMKMKCETSASTQRHDKLRFSNAKNKNNATHDNEMESFR